MKKYQKIQTLFLRDENNVIIPTMFTRPEFEYLKDLKWEATEKIDGTNTSAQISYDGSTLKIEPCGRTENAQLPLPLVARLNEIFNENTVRAAFGEQMGKATPEDPFNIIIYGEGYGKKIQKGGNYLPDRVDFILFDVCVGSMWLTRESCEEIAAKFGVSIVPVIGMMTIQEAIDFVKAGFKSTIAENKDYDAEGLVLRTPCGLKGRNGERIITKIKTVDFVKYKNKYGDKVVNQRPNPKYND